MLYNLMVAVGGMITLVTLFAVFHLLAERKRALDGECSLNSFRCLGCLATGRCRQEGGDAKKIQGPVRSGAGTHSNPNPGSERKESS